MSLWSRRSVAFRIGVIYVVAFSLGAVGFASGVYAISVVAGASRELATERLVHLDHVLELRTAVAEQTSSARLYLLRPRPAIKDAYFRAHENTHRFLRLLESDRGLSKELLSTIRAQKSTFDKTLSTAIRLAGQGRSEEAAARATDPVIGKFDTDLHHLEDVVEAQATRIGESSVQLANLARLLSIIFGSAMVLVAAAGALIMYRLFNDVGRELGKGSSKLNSSSKDIAVATEQVSKGVESQLSQVVDTSSAMEEMTASIKEVSQSAKGASDEVTGVNADVQDNSRRLSQAVRGIKEANRSLIVLKERSDQIGEVIKLIGEIASQTNMLALNAAIEAARAGEHGKGFDVVAEEIRKLAMRTSQSTAEIAPVIESLQKETEQAAKLVADDARLAEEVGASFERVSAAVNGAAAKARSITEASAEQARTAEQIADALQAISGTGKEAAKSAEATASATHELVELADHMRRLTHRLKAG